jgi:hypothetical protein
VEDPKKQMDETGDASNVTMEQRAGRESRESKEEKS